MKREAELRKGCGKQYCPSCEEYTEDEYSFKCGQEGPVLNGENMLMLCPICQAKLEIFTETNYKWKQAVQKLKYWIEHNDCDLLNGLYSALEDTLLNNPKDKKALQLKGFIDDFFNKLNVEIDKILGELTQ